MTPSLVAMADDALQAARASGRSPILLGYHPNYSRNNPYQLLIYRRFAEAGIAVVPVDDPPDAMALRSLCSLGAPVVLHLHWTNWVLRDAETEEEVQLRVDHIAGLLTEAAGAGIKVIWTVHNVLPHDMTFPTTEKGLQQIIADNAAVVHVMSDSTLQALRGVTEVATNKIIVIPHPSHVGSYPDHLTREQARDALGIDRADVVYAMVGRLKPYKGLN